MQHFSQLLYIQNQMALEIVSNKKLLSNKPKSLSIFIDILKYCYYQYIDKLIMGRQIPNSTQISSSQSILFKRIFAILVLILVSTLSFSHDDECKPIQQNIINIQYELKTQNYLPINPLLRNSNEIIADVLYQNDELLKQRKQLIQKRVHLVNQYASWQNILLAKYNFIVNQSMLNESIQANKKDWQRLQDKFNLSSVREELPMCIVVPTYNNNAQFRIEGNLNSIFTQNYSNYKAVIINDNSNDGSNEIYRKYFNFYGINKKNYVYIENLKKKSTLQNHHLASLYHCDLESIILHIDGDDQLIGRNTLQLFNWAFQTKKAGVIYTNFYFYLGNSILQKGFTTQYSDEQKQKQLYRDVSWKISHLRASRTELFRQIDIRKLQDHRKSYYKIGADQALMLSLMELSCGRVHKIQGQFNYFYNFATGNNNYFGDFRQTGSEIVQRMRRQKKHECSQQFDKKMAQ